MDLKIGDVVSLKSDVNINVLMTINGYSRIGDDYWYCIWFDGKDLKANDFHKDALQKYN